MTESAWPHDEGLETNETDLIIPVETTKTAPAHHSPATPQSPPPASGSKSDAAKDEGGLPATPLMLRSTFRRRSKTRPPLSRQRSRPTRVT